MPKIRSDWRTITAPLLRLWNAPLGNLCSPRSLLEHWSKDCATPPLQMSYPALEAFCKDEDNGEGGIKEVAH